VGERVELTVRHLASGGTTVVRAARLIKAAGFDIEAIDPFPLSSEQVRSVSPNSFDLRCPELRESTTPVWVVGSGKTAMDTVHTLVTDNPGREIGVVAGSGTYFGIRERFYPSGARRWFGGRRTNQMITELARRFDGTNEDDVRRWWLQDYATSVVEDPKHNLFGVISAAEIETIRAGTREVVEDHFEDVVDQGGVPHLVLRSGATRELEPGSWVVNCTGYFTPRANPPESYASESGRVLSINRSSVTLGFTSFSGYFLTHLMFLDELTDLPLYAADMDDIKRKTGAALPLVIATLLQYNLSVIFEAVPTKVFQQCGLDFDLMYPLPRRLAGQVRFMATHKRDRERHRRTLDTVRERFGVRCGPIGPERAVTAPA
jgi:hypothetical protein